MTQGTNALGQAIGPALDDWVPPPAPLRAVIIGRHCRLEPLQADRHASHLYEANALDAKGRNWTYLSYGPSGELAGFRAWIDASCQSDDPLYFAIVPRATGRAAGVASYLRVAPAGGSIEVGHINFSPLLARTREATAAMHLMMKHAFALGYRRYEWKCDALNAPSRVAAQRLGFSFEGIFRQATVYKGRSRNTAWYSVIDQEWPALDRAFAAWLDESNFDAAGRQRLRLSALTAPLLKQRG